MLCLRYCVMDLCSNSIVTLAAPVQPFRLGGMFKSRSVCSVPYAFHLKMMDWTLLREILRD